MKIGIPKALYYYSYPGLWEKFFSYLGFETVVSGKSTNSTIQTASAVSEAEHCLPNKIFDAHIDSLIASTDIIFIPKVISMVKGHIACPKLGALPDASKAAIAKGAEVISIEINETRESLKKTMEKLGISLGCSRKLSKKAVKAAFSEMEQREQLVKEEQSLLTKDKKFLLLGHPYTLNDAFISNPIKKKLTELEVPYEIITFEDRSFAPDEILWCTFSKMYKKLQNFNFEQYSGVIQISTFNCGADSMMIERFRRHCSRNKIPYMVLMIDEHSAQAGIDTRLEAFVDSLAWERSNG